MSFSASVEKLVAESGNPLVGKANEWRRVPLSSVVRIVNGFPLKAELFSEQGKTPVIRIRDVTAGQAGTFYSGLIPEGYWVEPGEIVIGMDGDFNSRVWQGEKALLNQRVCKLEPDTKQINKQFLAYLLPGYLQLINEATHSITVKHLSSKTIGQIPLPCPPLDEQRRIVAKLDALFARTKRARAELAHVPRLVERAKQAVLAQAFSGELTRDLRENEYLAEDGPWIIPLEWKWGTIADVAEIQSNLVAPIEVLDLPHIAPNHIESGIPCLLPFRTVREDEVISAKHRFSAGQIIYSKIRPYLRKAVLVDFEGVCSADMYPIRAKCDSKYLLYWLISPEFTNLSMEHQGRTVLPKINQNALYKIATPIPPDQEQREIVARIEVAFARIERGAAEAARATALLDRMEQAALAKAFRGEL